MIGAVSPDAKAGDLVAVYDKEGNRFGAGLFNPRARVPLRVVVHGDQPVGEDYFTTALARAVDWRVKSLQLDEQTDAYRVVNSDGDGLSGLIVDRFGDTLSVEVHSLGVYQRLSAWLKLLHDRLGTKREVVQVDERAGRAEEIPPQPLAGKSVRIREHGVRYEVNFAGGHKTGFFCDQRDNRLKFARLARGCRVLDLCCYTGGFAVAAAVLAGGEDVTGVDLDEDALAQARRNGNLNQQTRLRWVHADAYAFARQMYKNGELWGAVVLDPPKLLESREDERDGYRKYEDLNSLGAQLVAPGGLFVTCSCSGLLSEEDFEQLVIRSVHRLNRRLQIFDRTGTGADHPVMSNCLEGRYLKVLWARVF
jgi:23S rRNA (cytosine1962-C5)-methyltransferase